MKKFFTLLALVLMSCMGAWAQQKAIGTPITSASELTDGEYVISAWSKGQEGLLVGNQYANISTTTVTSGTVITDATWIWTVEKNGDTFTLAKSNGDKISVQGEQGIGKHNIQWVSGGYDVANFTMNTTVVSIGGVNHWMLHQQNQMAGATNATDDQKMAYLHCNYDSRGNGGEKLRLSWWEGYNAGTGTNVSCDKFAFYPVVTITAEQEQLSSLIQTVTTAYNNNNNPTYGTNLITQASQFSSPFSQNDLGNTDGGNLSAGVLIDNNTNTYWHSYWGGGDKTNHSHYVQVALSEPVDGTIKVTMSRRADADNDHCELLGVWACNTADGEYVQISQVSLPYTGRGTTVTGSFTLTTPYQYFRFWNDDSNGSGYDRGYWHMSEFQLNKKTAEPYNTTHPELAAAIETALSKANAALSTATQADIDALQRVYDMYRNNSYSATITAGDNGNFGTLCLPYATTVPTGVDAYTLTTLENEHIAFTKAYPAGSTLPAEEPVLLVGDNAGSYNFVGTTNTAKVDPNLFLGTPNAETVDMGGNDIYVLAKDGGDICFMRTNASNVNAYKAYIKTGVALSSALRIDFDGTTAINGVTSNSENTIFDLSGRKVNNARNGFYIVNGKKVIR